MQLEGANVLLTGGQGGLGKTLADRLRAQGAKVQTAGIDSGETYAVDFSDLGSLENFCAQIAKEPVDVLVNNAGLQYFGRTHEQSSLSIHRMTMVNLETPLQLARTLIPGMLARGRGQIVNIGSVFAAIPFPHFGVYSATKGGIRAFSQSIRREYAGRGLEVTYIAPRAMKTAMSTGPVFELLKKTGSTMDMPETVAAKIVRAIETGRHDVSIGLPEAFFTKINALLPNIVDYAMLKSRDIGDTLLAPAKT